MIIKTIQLVLDINGDLIDKVYNPVSSQSNYKHIIQIVAPHSITDAVDATVSSYKDIHSSKTFRLRPAQKQMYTTTIATNIVANDECEILTVGSTDYTLIGASANTVGTIFTATGAATGTGTVSVITDGSYYKGIDVVDSGRSYYQSVVDYNVWEAEIVGPALSIVQKINSTKFALTVAFSQAVVDPNTTNYLGTFGSIESTILDLPTITTESTGDYYKCGSLSFASTEAGVTFNYAEIAYYNGTSWVKGQNFVFRNSMPITYINVDPSLELVYDPVEPDLTSDIVTSLTEVEGNITTLSTNQVATDAALLLKADLVGGLVPVEQLPDAFVLTSTDELPQGATNLYASANATNQGNTFNGVSELVQLDASGKLPALDGSALTGLVSAPISSVNGFTGAVLLTTSEIPEGLSLYYTEARVSANADVVQSVEHTAASGNPHNITSLDVGLENVDNTSDANKPISTVQQTALNLKADLVGGLVPSSQLPSYVDDVLEYINFAGFPVTGESGKLYVDITTNDTYRWSGTVYIKIIDVLSAADVKTLYESNLDTNVFTDAEKTKLGVITVTQSVDLDAIETKINGIETNATADQTGAEIKLAYEAELDTNAFTDAEQTKLSNVPSDTNAELLVHTNEITDLYDHMTFFNGTVKEEFNCITEAIDGTNIYATLEKTGGGDLTLQFSTGDVTLDCTPIKKILLTPGTATSLQKNFIYIPISTKVLTVSTVSWPSEEHIRIAYIGLLDYTYTNSEAPIINQNWNDHLASPNGQGHLTHITSWIRRQHASWVSGIDGLGTDEYITITTNAAAPDNVDFKASGGVLSQLHLHSYVGTDTTLGDDLHIINHPTTPYVAVTDLNTQLTDSLGASMSGQFFTIVVWVSANKGSTYDPIMINLPSGSYAKQADALADINNYTNMSIPSEFIHDSGTGQLIAAITFEHSALSSGTWTVVRTLDLRQTTPAAISSASITSLGTQVLDNEFKINDNLDITKQLAFNVDSISTNTLRTITMPDTDINLGDIALKANTTDVYTSAQTDTAISTAISALVDSSPATLDTLNELAAALGDDPNFATTVTNSIATKETIANVDTLKGAGWTTQTVKGNSDSIGVNLTAIALNTAKVGITAQQATDITTNNAKISYTDATAVSLNTAKISADANATNQGNTFNGINQLVQLNETGQLPAIDGSLLTNLPSGGATTLDGLTDTSFATVTNGDFLLKTVVGWQNVPFYLGYAFDMKDTTKTNGDILVWNSTSSWWEPQAASSSLTNTDDLSEGSTNLYYTEARVSANTSVVSNTSHKNTNTGNPHSVTKTEVGLGNVDNTSDADKPISAATQSALGDKADLVGGLVPSNQLPSYVDDVIEAASYSVLPGTGETGKLYVVIADETDGGNTSTYRWSGSVYVQVSDVMNGAEIKTLYEAEADTNAYTNTEKTKLSGIATGAEVNTVDSVNGETGTVSLSLDDLDNTTITTPATDQVLTYNGSAWVNQDKSDNYTDTLPITGWTGASAPYTIARTVTGITATDEPFIDLDLSSVTYANVADTQTAWSKVYRAVTSADTITFYASEVPTIVVPLNIKVVN